MLVADPRVETVIIASPQDTHRDFALAALRFGSGLTGLMLVSRLATGRKMGYAHDICGTNGTVRFDDKDQNALWLFLADGPEARRGFRKFRPAPSR